MNLCKICFHHLDEGLTLQEYFLENDCICGNCRHKFIKNETIYEYQNLRIHAFYLYNDVMESLLFQYKEGRDIALKDIFLWKYKKKMNDIFRHHECIIVPSHEEKIKTRGFHHLKKMLECCDIEGKDYFIKTINYKQSSQRSKNREKVKDIIQIKQFPKKQYYLFDDVVTSGNTLLAAASLLSKNNEKVEVYALSVHPHFVELCEKQKL